MGTMPMNQQSLPPAPKTPTPMGAQSSGAYGGGGKLPFSPAMPMQNNPMPRGMAPMRGTMQYNPPNGPTMARDNGGVVNPMMQMLKGRAE
jgi:hypothetical protein